MGNGTAVCLLQALFPTGGGLLVSFCSCYKFPPPTVAPTEESVEEFRSRELQVIQLLYCSCCSETKPSPQRKTASVMEREHRGVDRPVAVIATTHCRRPKWMGNRCSRIVYETTLIRPLRHRSLVS